MAQMNAKARANCHKALDHLMDRGSEVICIVTETDGALHCAWGTVDQEEISHHERNLVIGLTNSLNGKHNGQHIYRTDTGKEIDDTANLA